MSKKIESQTCPHCGCSGQEPDSLKCDDCGKNLPAAVCTSRVDCVCAGCATFWRRVELAKSPAGIKRLRADFAKEAA